MRVNLMFVAIAIAVLGSGCGTLFGGGPDTIAVTSSPAGAKVFLDGQEVGVTPIAVALDRKRSSGSLRVEAAGYEPAVSQRSKTFNTVAILNCVNVLFWAIDLITSNHEKFDTAPFHVNLVPAGGPAGGPPGVRPDISEPIR